jgi:hypothetical protein
MFGGKTPDITAAQVLAFATWAASQAVAFGWINDNQSQVLLSAGATAVAAAWKIADAFLRGKRADNADKLGL